MPPFFSLLKSNSTILETRRGKSAWLYNRGHLPAHETVLALFVHWPRDSHCLLEGPCSLYPRGHENVQFVLIFISDVTQSLGEVLTR